MKYTEKYNVRWHDTDANREVHPSGVLTFMQETGNRQFQTAGRPLDAIRDEQGVGFILSRIAIDMLAPIHAYEDILVETFTCPSRGFTFPRGFEIKRGGRVVARAASQWALVRVKDRSLVRAEEFPLDFGDEPELQTEMPLRFRIPRELAWEQVGERRIAFSDIDYNMHMNNTKYPDMLCDFMPIEQVANISEMTLEFLRESALGDTLEFSCAVENNDFYFKTANSSKDACLSAKITVE